MAKFCAFLVVQFDVLFIFFPSIVKNVKRKWNVKRKTKFFTSNSETTDLFFMLSSFKIEQKSSLIERMKCEKDYLTNIRHSMDR